MASYAEHFEREFNRLLGNRTGRPMATGQPYQVTPRYATQSPKRAQQLISTGVIDLPTNVENAYEDTFGEAAVGGGSSGWGHVYNDIMRESKKTQRGIVRDYDKATKKWQNEVAEVDRVNQAQQQLEKISGDLTSESNPLSRGIKRGVYGALDLLNRPSNIVAGFASEGPLSDDATKHEAFNFSQWWKGIYQGATNKKQYDWGDVAEQYMPDAPHPVKVASAVAANLFADPLNLVGVGGVKYATGVKGSLDTTRLARSTAEAVQRALDKSPLPHGSRGLRMPGANAVYGTSDQATRAAVDKVVRETVANQALNIKGGGVRGRLNVGSRAGFAATHADRATAAARQTLFQRYDDFVEQFKAHIRSRSNGGPDILTPGQIKQMRKGDQHFDDFWNEVDRLSSGGRVSPSKWESIMGTADDAVRRNLNKPLEDLTKNIYDEVIGSYHHAPALRFGGATVPLRRIGKAMEVVSSKVMSKEMTADRIRSLAHSGMFPGKLAILQQKGRAIGVSKLEEFQKAVSAKAREFTRAERAEITRALEAPPGMGPSFPHNPKLQSGFDFIKTHLDRMWDEELSAGARRLGSQKLENYTFVWNRKGNTRDLGDFKIKRKDQINSSGSAVNFNIDAAKKAGFKPVEDAFDMVLMRQIKSNRDMTRALFRNDLIDNFGSQYRNLSDDMAVRQKLEPMDFNHLSDDLRMKIDPGAGDKYYLSRQMNKAMRDFEELSKFSTDPVVLRWTRKITNFFKAGATVYNPGYHVRNIMSDFVMGLLDGVNTNMYTEMMRKGAVKRLPGEKLPRFRFRTGAKFKFGPGWEVTADEAQALFKNNAAGGGFFGPEFGRNPVSNIFSRINQGVRKASEVREDFGRMGHFFSALKDEYAGLLKSGMKPDAAKAKAVEQAVYRVNHYKFDYGALTKWESKYMKAAFPFYTFARKAVPSLTESFLMNPKWLRRYNVLQRSFDGDESKNFNSFFIPQYIKDMGYAVLKDEKEPTVASLETLPTGAFSSIIPKKWSAQGVADMVMQQLNPVAQLPVEIQQGKELYSGRDVGGLLPSGPEDIGYLARKFLSPASNLQRGYQDIQRGDPLWRVGLTNRLMGGLPIRKVTQGQMDFARKTWEDENIQGRPNAPIDKFNAGPGAEKGIRVYLSQNETSGMSSYKVKDDHTGEILFQSGSPWDAMQFAEQASVSSQTPVNMDEWNDTVGRKSNIRVYYSQRKDGTSYRVKNIKTGKIIYDVKSPERAMELANTRAAG